MTRLLILALCLLPAVGQAQSYNSLTAAADIHAKLQDNAASTAIVNANGTGGTLTNAGNTSASTTTGPTAWLPAAISLDGTDDYVDFDKPAGWTAYPVSFGVWCRLNAVSGDRVAASLHVNGATSQYLALYANDSANSNRPAIVARNSTEFKTASASGATTAWAFVSATYHSATDRRLFINGALVATGTTSVTIPSANKLAFGRLRTSGSALSVAGAIAGAIGDNAAWSDADHAQLYAGPEPTLTSGATIDETGETVAPVFSAENNGSVAVSTQWQWYDPVEEDWNSIGGWTDTDEGPADRGVISGAYRLAYSPSNDGGEGETHYSNEVEYEEPSGGAAFIYYQTLYAK
jgi:hypothetical protein